MAEFILTLPWRVRHVPNPCTLACVLSVRSEALCDAGTGADTERARSRLGGPRRSPRRMSTGHVGHSRSLHFQWPRKAHAKRGVMGRRSGPHRHRGDCSPPSAHRAPSPMLPRGVGAPGANLRYHAIPSPAVPVRSLVRPPVALCHVPHHRHTHSAPVHDQVRHDRDCQLPMPNHGVVAGGK